MVVRADRILKFITNFHFPGRIPKGISILEPWKSPEAFEVCSLFYRKYYTDTSERVAIFGINPGRFGGGQTGIPFTDPVRLYADCGIPNSFAPKPELSSDFVYRVIQAFGGAEKFYKKFFISSVCPLGFTKDGKNLNYYDDPVLLKKVEELLPGWMEKQFGIGLERQVAFCLGEGKNFEFLQSMNIRNKWFESVVPLPHPRFIMQYRRKRLTEFTGLYVNSLNAFAGKI